MSHALATFFSSFDRLVINFSKCDERAFQLDSSSKKHVDLLMLDRFLSQK